MNEDGQNARRLRSGRLAKSLFLIAMLSPLHARAQPDAAQKALATKLFNEGKILMNEGQTREACARLEESQRLDPAPGTLLNLAVCHEKLGMTATAWAEYCDARVVAQRDGRNDRVAFADAHARALEARLSRLVINVSSDADLTDLVVRRDGAAVPRTAWGTPLPIDPGEHVVEASAPGHATRRIRVRVSPDADTMAATILRLDDEAPPASLAPAREFSPALPIRGGLPPMPLDAGVSRRRTALALTGGGALSIGVAAFLGLRAIDLRRQSDAWCPFGGCTGRGVALNDHATLFADLSTSAFALGIASLAAAGYLALTGHHTSAAAGRSIALVGVGAAGGGVVDLSGVF